MADASIGHPWINPQMFDQASIQRRTEAFGIKKSPIKMKNPSTKPRFCPRIVEAAFSFQHQHPQSFQPHQPPAVHVTAAPAAQPVQNITIVDGFCSKLDAAARTGDLAAIELCIKQGADINQKSVLSQQSPLSASIQCGQPMATRLLLTKGADIYQVRPAASPSSVCSCSSAHSSLTHEQRDAHGRTCVELALCLQKQSVADQLHKLSLHLFCSSIAAACRFSAHMYAHAVCRYQRCDRPFSSAAMSRLKARDVKRCVTGTSRRRMLSWTAWAGVLAHRLSFDFSRSADDARLVFQGGVHRAMMATCGRSGAALKFADIEASAVVN
jgi:hypothetical protein